MDEILCCKARKECDQGNKEPFIQKSANRCILLRHTGLIPITYDRLPGYSTLRDKILVSMERKGLKQLYRDINLGKGSMYNN